MIENRNKIITAVDYLDNELALTKEMIIEINSILIPSQESKRQFIVNEIQSAIDCVFEEDYKFDLVMKPYRDTFKAQLLLYTEDQNGKRDYYNPNTQNGGLCRQVISLAAGFAVAKLSNCHLIIMDEATNGGDDISTRKLQPLLQSYLDYHEDNTIILNEHKPALYEDMSCKIYHFHKEGKGMSGYVTIDEIEEQIGRELQNIELQGEEK